MSTTTATPWAPLPSSTSSPTTVTSLSQDTSQNNGYNGSGGGGSAVLYRAFIIRASPLRADVGPDSVHVPRDAHRSRVCFGLHPRTTSSPPGPPAPADRADARRRPCAPPSWMGRRRISCVPKEEGGGAATTSCHEGALGCSWRREDGLGGDHGACPLLLEGPGV
jgi:hypothetical protein